MRSNPGPRRFTPILRLCRPLAAAMACVALSLAGCSKFEQVQYFEVVGPPDPITGLASRSYYRMTVEGRGMGVEEYKMRAAYLSSSALDTLDGKIPTIPAADMDEDRRTYFKAIRAAYLRTAQARAEELAGQYADGGMDPQQFDQVMTEIARAVWAVTLSDSDLASLGQVRSVDPFEFRKLVFYASARAVALDRYNAQVDSAIQKTSALAGLFDRSRVQRQTTTDAELLEKARAVQRLGEQIQQLEDRKHAAEASRDSVRTRLQPLIDAKAAVEAVLPDQREQLKQTQADRDAMLATLNNDNPAEDVVNSLNEQIAAAKLKIDSFQAIVDSNDELVSDLGSQIGVLQPKLDGLNDDIAQYKLDLQALTSSLAIAVSELNTLAQSAGTPQDTGDGGGQGTDGQDEPDPGDDTE